MADFKVIRGTSIITSGNLTLTIIEGTDYTLESGVTINDAFIRITGAWNSGQGQTSGGAVQNAKESNVRIDNPENLLTSIDFVRLNTTSNTRLTWEIIQYIGSSGGDNEFIVRRASDELVASSVTTADGTTITTISDIDKCAIFLTGQCWGGNAHPAQTGYSTLAFVADGDDWFVRSTRGVGNNTWYGSYAVIEFTGSNWRDVQRVEFTAADHGATIWDTGSPNNSGTYSIPTSLLDASKAFLHVQFRHLLDWSLRPQQLWNNIELTSSTTLFTCRRPSTYAGASQIFVVWVIENTQSGAGEMSVQHIASYRSDTTGGEEKLWTHAVTSVSAMDETSLMGECSSHINADYNQNPMGLISMRLTDTDEVTLISTERDYEERYSFDVVQWPYPGEVTAYKDVTLKTSLDILVYKDVILKTSLVGGYELSGITYDKDSVILGSCQCYLFKDNLDNTLTFIAHTVSNAVTGAYTFTEIVGDDPQYLVVAWKDDSPHIFDVTDHVLQPSAS